MVAALAWAVDMGVAPRGLGNARVAMRDMQAATLANEKSCFRYEWYRASTPQTYILLEDWADLAAAQEHLKAPHIVSAVENYCRSSLGEKFPRLSGLRSCETPPG